MKQHSLLMLILSTVLCLTLQSASAAEIKLTSQPAKCVSLKQGNICYQDIVMRWQASLAADYCLYHKIEPEPLKCWQAQDHGEYKFEFKFAETQQYVLRQQGQDEDLAQSSIEVKWVYKVRRNQFSWRVF